MIARVMPSGRALDTALVLAKAGLSILPVRIVKGKNGRWDKPTLLDDWPNAASSDAATVRAWWRQWSEAQPALALGKADLVVIDADRHGGPDGVTAFEGMVAENGDLPEHPIATTASDGEHHYFRQPPGEPLGNSEGELRGLGINVRGRGGYVVAPGARRPDGARWSCPGFAEAFAAGTIPVLPDWLATKIRGGTERKRARAKAPMPWSAEREAQVRKALAHIDSEDREVWLRIGMALHSTGWERARELWDEWSETSAKYEAGGQETAWSSFERSYNGVPVSLPTLFYMARQNPKYRPDWPDTDGKGNPQKSCANARRAIELLGIECKHDKFSERKMLGGHVIDQWAGELSEDAVLMLRKLIREEFGFDPGKHNTGDAANQMCLQNGFDPVVEYLDALEWDGHPRLDRWLVEYLGAKDKPLTRAIGRRVLVAAVRRARQPGSKFDQILVLEGEEGRGKSSAVAILAGPEHFSDQTILGLDDKHQQEQLRGKWLFEIADLAGMSKADVDKVKAFVSRQCDRARPAYGRYVIEASRRTVFIGTTNSDTYLKSQTGNRRFWPVKTGAIDLEALRRNRNQLWAEAAAAEAAGETLVLPGELWGVATREQERRRDHDPWDDALRDVKGSEHDSSDGREREERILAAQIFRDHLLLPMDRWSDAAFKRLSYCMARLGWEKAAHPIKTSAGRGRGFRRATKE
jgi:hypothetical protein